MAGIGNHDEPRFGPGISQIVGGGNRADDIVPAMNDGRRYVPDPVDFGQQVVFRTEQIVAEKMRLDPRQAQRMGVLAGRRDGVRIGQQRRAGAFIHAPGPRRRQMDDRIRVDQPAVIPFQQVALFVFRQKFAEGLPGLRENRLHAIEKPIDLAAPHQENSAQRQCQASLGMGLPVAQCQGAAP